MYVESQSNRCSISFSTARSGGSAPSIRLAERVDAAPMVDPPPALEGCPKCSNLIGHDTMSARDAQVSCSQAVNLLNWTTIALGWDEHHEQPDDHRPARCPAPARAEPGTTRDGAVPGDDSRCGTKHSSGADG